ncbi:hypothetical protein ACFW0P_18025 [Lysobacter soli]|uniref:hypothetical protein n=1 Tax=Lysobacter soli TaxID=453783 RepID=UPI003698AC47
MDDDDAIESFVSSIDHQDGYLVSKKGGADPRAQLLTRRLIATSILADKKKFSQARDDYLDEVPDHKKLFSRVIEPYFCSFGADPIPVIEIPTNTGLDSIARIFTTLNTTGQLLTPFELVVAKLYPSGIELDKDVASLKESKIYYSRMDATGEILLQTVALLEGKDPKKANLPRTISGDLYKKHRDVAVESLDALGKFLTDQLGAGLDSTAAETLVPYDAVYAPMAVALREIRSGSLSSTKRAKLERALEQWYVASALSQRYQEGVHNKQEKDLRDFRLLLEGTTTELPLLSGISYRRMIGATPAGAIGKLIKGMLNMRNPRDPSTDKPVGFNATAGSTEKHHIFATRWCPTGLAGWSEDTSRSDLALNLMLVEEKTNKRWVNFSPGDQIKDAVNHGTPLARVRELYAFQHIPENAFDILQKENLAQNDFEDFLVIREAAIQKFIRDRFDLDVSAPGSSEADSEDDGP